MRLSTLLTVPWIDLNPWIDLKPWIDVTETELGATVIAVGPWVNEE